MIYRTLQALQNTEISSSKHPQNSQLGRKPHNIADSMSTKGNVSNHIELANEFSSLHSEIKLDINVKDNLAEKTARFLRANLAHEVKLNALAQEMATNRTTLSQTFKEYFGKSIFSWLREQRMLHAAELLSAAPWNIQVIAAQVGYSDSNNFSTAFKRAFQISPKQHRKNCSNQRLIMHPSKVGGEKLNYNSE